MELLAPAGNWAALEAAFANGADAVYLGGREFSARQSADNFAPEEIQRAVEYARLRDKKIYVTCNILIDNQEFAPALDYLYSLYLKGVDALIVQDLGLLNAAGKILPDMPVHASTQMTVHNSEAVALLKEIGVSRVVLAREMSLAEMVLIKKDNPEMEFEVFVHGALCFCYSGQCLFSSLVGGRSGNRGRCAQPCRLSYRLLTDDGRGKKSLAADGRYLLSPADLSLVEHLPDLQKAGVASLKIEGRMKRAEYVAVVTSAYREALDMLPSGPDPVAMEGLKKKLYQVFNRNLSKGYLIPGQQVLSIKRPNNRGTYLGRVVSHSDGFITIRLSDKLSLGDGLEVWVSQGKGPHSVVKAIEKDGKSLASARPGQVVTIPVSGWAAPGDRVFKTHDEELMKAAHDSVKAARDFRIPINMKVSIREGCPLKLAVQDNKGHEVQVFGKITAEVAQEKPLDQEVILEKLTRLGGTPFALDQHQIEYDGNLILPYSELNDCRRRAVEKLLALIYNRPDNGGKKPPHQLGVQAKPANAAEKRRLTAPLLSVTVSSIEAARKVIEAGADRVYVSMGGPGGKPFTVSDVCDIVSVARKRGIEIVPALPRIQKPGEFDLWSGLDPAICPVILAGNLGALGWGKKKGFICRGDYSLNCFNQHTLDWLLENHVAGTCLSPELNLEQLQGFHKMDSAEMLVHGDLIIMISESCPIKEVQKGPQDRCGNICRQGRYWLCDDKGYEFPAATDRHCRFYLFNSRRLCLLSELAHILPLGCESLRIEAWLESPDEAAETVAVYRQALQSLVKGKKVDLMRLNQILQRKQGFTPTKGHFYRGVK